MKNTIANDIYKSIRPYNDDEIPEVVKEVYNYLSGSDTFEHILPRETLSFILSKIKKINTIREYQREITYPLIKSVVEKTTSSIIVKGFENVDRNTPYLFVSNHRDIVLDAAILQMILIENKMEVTEMAVGNNLFFDPLIERVAKGNNMITVLRDNNLKETFQNSKLLSSYIRYVINQKCNSVWISQRNGRTKDGIDITEPALLKMFDMSGENDFVKNFEDLNILPISISYEYEPCDDLKVQEMYLSRISQYQKSEGEDERSVIQGLNAYKGNVQLRFGKPLTLNEIKNAAQQSNNDRYKTLANSIDRQIYSNYKIWKTSYIASDILNETNTYQYKYTMEEKILFQEYLKRKIEGLHGDKQEIKKMFLNLYANPIGTKNSIINL